MEDIKGEHKKGRLVLKVVPWINKLEFETVHAKLFSSDPVGQKWAIDRISAWRARNPTKIPIWVEATENLVDAKIQDYAVQNNISVNFRAVSNAYTTGLTRFVLLIEDRRADNRTPLRLIARKYGIPEQIIKLRHKIIHNRICLSLEELRSATDVCLQWLDQRCWKLEIANTKDYCPVFRDVDKVACHLLSRFQNLQHKYLFGKENSTRRRISKSAVDEIVAEIASLNKKKGKHLVKILAKPEFLLSLRVCSSPLVENSDPFIEKEAVALPNNVQKFWKPVIAVIHQNNLLEELVLALLKGHNKLGDENQRMAIAWIWKILEASCDSWSTQEKEELNVFKAVRQMPPIFNWLELMDVCLHNVSKYIPAVLPIIVDSVYPPIPESKKNGIMGLVAIATGALSDVCSSNAEPTTASRVYTVENVKTVLELQNVIDRGETSLCHTENPWKLATDDINWADYPLGYVFGTKNGTPNPEDLQLDVLSQKKCDAQGETPEEQTVVAMECDLNKLLNESSEAPAENEQLEDLELEVEENESCVTECSAYYCDPEDICIF